MVRIKPLFGYRLESNKRIMSLFNDYNFLVDNHISSSDLLLITKIPNIKEELDNLVRVYNYEQQQIIDYLIERITITIICKKKNADNIILPINELNGIVEIRYKNNDETYTKEFFSNENPNENPNISPFFDDQGMTSIEIKGNFNHLGYLSAFDSNVEIISITNFNGISHNITNLNNLFSNCTEFNQDIGDWDVSSVNKMSYMFYKASMFNQDISMWNVSTVEEMTGMFWLAGNFNQDISKWDVSVVNDMSGMFNNANRFNQTISKWNVANVTNMSNMFFQTTNFNQTISKWNVTNVTNMSNMFYEATNFNNGVTIEDVEGFGRNSLLYMGGIATKFNETNTNVSIYEHFATRSKLIENFNFNQSLLYYTELFTANISITFTKNEASNQDYILLPINGINNGDVVKVVYLKEDIDGSIKLITEHITSENQRIDPFFENSTTTVTIEGKYSHLGYKINKDDVSEDLIDIFSNSAKITTISNFNMIYENITDLSFLFGLNDKYSQDITNWNVTNITNMTGMFYYNNVFNQYIGGWDVSNVKDMSDMFNGASAFVGTDIGAWNVSGCTDMSNMFNGASGFNGNVGGWERPADGVIEKSTVSNVENMFDMFTNAEKFEGTGIGAWNVSGCTDMESMFNGALLFNGSVEGWERPADGVIEKSTVSNVENMNNMFFNAEKFEGTGIGAWNVSGCTDMESMFNGALLFNGSVEGWERPADGVIEKSTVSNVENMNNMFFNAEKFEGTGIGAWNVSGCKNMSGMFNGATVFNGNVEGWERPADGVIEKSTVRNVESMNFMFFDAEKFEGTNIGAWNVSGCTDMSSMFNGALLFNGNVEGWERPADGVIEKSTVSNVESMDGMFDRAKIFVGTGIGAWNVSGCKSMADMFSGASVFNGNVEGWERPANETGIEKSTVSNVVSMLGMFAGAINFVGTDIGAWNVSGCKSMADMFSGASVFNGNVEGWERPANETGIEKSTVSNVVSMLGMFAGAINFVGTDIGAWNVSGCKSMAGMFSGASVFNGNVEGWERPADGENGIDKSTVINVESMDFMFSGAKIFVGTGIGAWNVSGCTDMSSMFNGALLFNGNIEGWERPANETGDIEKTTVSSVENMNNMFTFATSFNSIISNWDVSSCTTMAGMFNGATAFNNGSTGSSADGRNSLLNSEFDTTNNSVTTFTDFATGAKLIEDLGGSEITAFYNVLFINTQ